MIVVATLIPESVPYEEDRGREKKVVHEAT